jgi:hypothetical protein
MLRLIQGPHKIVMPLLNDQLMGELVRTDGGAERRELNLEEGEARDLSSVLELAGLYAAQSFGVVGPGLRRRSVPDIRVRITF